MIDQFSKWVEVVELGKDKSPTSDWIIDNFLENWVFRFGLPEFLITDNKASFVSRIMKRLMGILKINKIESTPYYPQGNAVIETFHRTLNRRLRNFYYKPIEFKDALKYILFGYRIMIHSLTGNFPFYLLYGYNPRITPDIDWRFIEDKDEFSRLRFLGLMKLEVQLRAQVILGMQNKRLNKEREIIQFEEGMLVMHNSPEHRKHLYFQTSLKATPIWSIPHRIIKVSQHHPEVAFAQCIITKKITKVDIMNCRIILFS